MSENKKKLRKHSHAWLPEGKLKVWLESDIGDFTVTVDENVDRNNLDETIKQEYERRKALKQRVKDLGIGEEVK